MQGDAGEDIDQGPVGQLEHLDEVEELELDRALANRWEMPARRGRRPPLSLAAIDGAAAGEDTTDRAYRGRGDAFSQKGFMNDHGSALTQDALFELRAFVEHAILEPGRLRFGA